MTSITCISSNLKLVGERIRCRLCLKLELWVTSGNLENGLIHVLREQGSGSRRRHVDIAYKLILLKHIISLEDFIRTIKIRLIICFTLTVSIHLFCKAIKCDFW